MNQPEEYSPEKAFQQARSSGAPLEESQGFRSLDEQLKFLNVECVVCNNQPGCVKVDKLGKCSATSVLYWNDRYFFRNEKEVAMCRYKNKELPKE